MTEEGLLCPLNIVRMSKSVANILCIYFKCRKGRGPYLSFWSSPRRYASLWNYVRFMALGSIFLVITHLDQTGDYELYLHVIFVPIRPTEYFLLIFEINISGRR